MEITLLWIDRGAAFMHDQVVEEAGTRSTKKTLFLTESTPQILALKRRPKKLGFHGPCTGLSFVEDSS
jgi:hypothetical protein